VNTDTAHRRETCIWLSELATWRPGLINRLCKQYGDLDQALMRPRHELVRLLAPRRPSAPDDPREGDAGAPDGGSEAAAFRRALARGAPGGRPPGPHESVLTYVDAGYPALLRQLHDPPPALYIRAATDCAAVSDRLRVLTEAPKVAVVGSRMCSAYGLEMAAAVAGDLAAKGIVVVSGLAMGADAAAHHGALKARSRGPLPTVAVLGCGADVVYPRLNARLCHAVERRGLVVSEFVWGTTARGWRFPSRNRIMAGLCHTVVVVEGSVRSGALITARHAHDLDREVFAVPGEAGRRLSEGPHELMRSAHALICEGGQDVLNWLERLRDTDPVAAGYLPPRPGESQMTGSADLKLPLAGWRLDEEGARAVLRRLDDGPATADELCAASGVPAPAVMALLSALELEGLARADGGGRFRAVRGG